MKEEKAIEKILEGCKELDWIIAIPDKKKKINYLIIGDDKKVKKIIRKIDKK